MKDVNAYKSKDFYLVAICIASRKLHLSRLEKGDNKFATFVLDDPDNIAHEIIKNHWDRTLRIPTRDLIEAIAELRARLNSGV